MSITLCRRVMVGSGTDQFDPVCEMLEGHTGPCKSSEAVDQNKLRGRWICPECGHEWVADWLLAGLPPKCPNDDRRGEPAHKYRARTSGQDHSPEITEDLAEQYPAGRTLTYEGHDVVGFLRLAAKLNLGRARVVIHVPPDKLDIASRIEALRP